MAASVLHNHWTIIVFVRVVNSTPYQIYVWPDSASQNYVPTLLKSDPPHALSVSDYHINITCFEKPLYAAHGNIVHVNVYLPLACWSICAGWIVRDVVLQQRNPVKAKKILSMKELKKGYLTQGPTKRKWVAPFPQGICCATFISISVMFYNCLYQRINKLGIAVRCSYASFTT